MDIEHTTFLYRLLHLSQAIVYCLQDKRDITNL
jgi:hypothetical protein